MTEAHTAHGLEFEPAHENPDGRQIARIEIQDSDDARESNLPPIDRGKAAWRLLWCAFVFEALLWGMLPSSAGC